MCSSDLVTATATVTPVVALPTDTPSPTEDVFGGDPRTQTVEALLTQSALTPGVPTTTALPDTGFFEDAGVPGILLVALALVVVIFIARRLRTVG